MKRITARYNDFAYKLERQAVRLATQGDNLARTADRIQKTNPAAACRGAPLNWITVLTLSVAILLVGDLVVSLQNQIHQLHQTIKDFPAALNPPSKAEERRLKFGLNYHETKR